jgi:uncharacterized protein
MFKNDDRQIIFSPSDLINYLKSSFSSWMDRYNIEHPGKFTPGEYSEDAQLIINAGNEHEEFVLKEFRNSGKSLIELKQRGDIAATVEAFRERPDIIYQAKLVADDWAGYSDFIMLDDGGRYQIWDTKLARSPKPYYAVQLCCYSEMYAAMTGEPMPEKFGIILGPDEKENRELVEFRVEDFIHYYRHLKDAFLEMHATFNGDLAKRPTPDPRGDHGKWQELADKYLDERDHLVRIAGITGGQIKKFNEAGIETLTQLAESGEIPISKISKTSLEKLIQQARLQKETREARKTDGQATAKFEVLPTEDDDGRPIGLAALPPEHAADVFFDMEGYPLKPGGLEYLFGNTTIDPETGEYEFTDFWAHDRDGEKRAFEEFIDWVYARWLANPGMHIYHYAPYEASTVRRLSTRHDTRQEELDNMLRHEVFVDLYKIVRRGLRIGEESYSLKKVEQIYWPESRTGTVTLSIGSVVHYARWMDSGEPGDWQNSKILSEIRDYNKDDCDSTAKLAKWLREVAAENNIPPGTDAKALRSADQSDLKELPEGVLERLALVEELRKDKDNKVAKVLSDIVEFHRREEKPIWWKMFARADADPEELFDDNGCIANVKAVGEPVAEKKSLVQRYQFDPTQECKLSTGSTVAFTINTAACPTIFDIDLTDGSVSLKAGSTVLEKLGGDFPLTGSLVPNEIVPTKPLQSALSAVAASYRDGSLNPATASLLTRKTPNGLLEQNKGTTVERAIAIANEMDGDCLVIQGPPGTGKTYTASHMIASLLADGKRVGITSNSHKAILNLTLACGDAVREGGRELHGVRASREKEDRLFDENPKLLYAKDGGDAAKIYSDGVLSGTAWTFSRDDFEGVFDFLFVDEAGQVPLANVVAISRSAKNLVLLGDQMQLEQPIQGAHPGDARLSALQYALKDLDASKEDATVFHPVVPPERGLFLGESRRMHPAVCGFISESVYEGRLRSIDDCGLQKIAVPAAAGCIKHNSGVVFCGVEHDGNIQQSDEEVAKIVEIYGDLIGRDFTDSNGMTKPLELDDLLFISPYNAQVRALQNVLPAGARVGSVDKFQGQEAPVCILSMCSSFGEYGSRGLAFILDQNRMNVAISRAKCLAIVVGDSRIAGSDAGSLNEMRLLNLYCKIVRLDKIES